MLSNRYIHHEFMKNTENILIIFIIFIYKIFINFYKKYKNLHKNIKNLYNDHQHVHSLSTYIEYSTDNILMITARTEKYPKN